MTKTNPLTSRIIPEGFPSTRDRELYMHALSRIELNLDLDFYNDPRNTGWVLKGKERVAINYGGKF